MLYRGPDSLSLNVLHDENSDARRSHSCDHRGRYVSHDILLVIAHIYIYVNIICRLDQGVCGKSTPVVVVRLTGFNSRKSSECDWLCFAESLMVLNLQLVNNIIDGRLVCVPLGGRERGLFKLDWITCRGYFQRLASGLKMLRDTKLLSGLG